MLTRPFYAVMLSIAVFRDVRHINMCILREAVQNHAVQYDGYCTVYKLGGGNPEFSSQSQSAVLLVMTC